LLDIIVLSILAVLCGANSYEKIADYGKTARRTKDNFKHKIAFAFGSRLEC